MEESSSGFGHSLYSDYIIINSRKENDDAADEDDSDVDSVPAPITTFF